MLINEYFSKSKSEKLKFLRVFFVSKETFSKLLYSKLIPYYELLIWYFSEIKLIKEFKSETKGIQGHNYFVNIFN